MDKISHRLRTLAVDDAIGHRIMFMNFGAQARNLRLIRKRVNNNYIANF